MRFESRLLFSDGEHPPTTYLRLTWRFVDVSLPIAAAQRLRDQLTAHLDATHSCPSTPTETIHSDLTPRNDGPPASRHRCLPECVGEAVRENAE